MQPAILDNRVARLRELLEQSGIQAAVLSRPQHIYYFSGHIPGPSPALLVVTQQRMLGIAASAIGACETLRYVDYDIYQGWNIGESVGRLLDHFLPGLLPPGSAIGLELDHFPAGWVPNVSPWFHEPRDLKEILWQVRRSKDSEEVRQIEVNIAGNDKVFEAIRGMLRPGISELDVWAVIQNRMCAQAGSPLILEADLGAAERGSNPDAKPGSAILHRGETLFVDIYSATHQYFADTTRVFSLGEPDDRQKEIHAVLLAALSAGEKRLGAGVPANQVDASTRGVIERAGFGEYFPHHSGHAYGLFQQEKPYFIPADSTPLEPGMIVTLEPGVYIPGWGGMRIESNYLIESSGPRRLDRFPLEIAVCS